MPKNSTQPQLARRLAIVNVLPRLTEKSTGHGMTVEQVVARLGPQYKVDRRTFERDLKELGDEHGEWRALGLEVIGRPSERDRRINEWFTTASSKILLFKSLTPTDALVANFASQELGPFLPHEARQSLDEQLAMIEQKVRHLQLTKEHRQSVAYRDKVRRVPDGSPLQASRVDPKHLQTVNDALMQNSMLRLVYRAARHTELKHHLVYPIGLVIHDRSLRLLAVPDAHLTLGTPSMVIKNFLLHRMKEVTNAGPAASNVRVPTLDEAIANGALAMWSKGLISLRLRFADGEDAAIFARTLEEMPLADDQTIYENSEAKLELSATVTNTSALRRMLQSMAREVKVLAPENLRDEIRRFLHDSLQFQQGD
jgi:predicted DNA-binding transcriptional regulator YafY